MTLYICIFFAFLAIVCTTFFIYCAQMASEDKLEYVPFTILGIIGTACAISIMFLC